MSTTRAVVLEATGATALREVPLPATEPGDVILSMEGCGLCGSDLFKLTAGRATALGHELVGRVESAPPDARFAVGDRVVVPHHVACQSCALCHRGQETMCVSFRENLLLPGGFAEKVLVRRRAVEHAMRRVPAQLGLEQALFLEPTACVLRGIDRAQLPEQAAVLILGAGSMGLLHLLVLRRLQPLRLIVVAEPIEQRRRLALQFGADVAVASTHDAVREAFAPHGADAVFDTAGGDGPLQLALAALRPGGSLVLFAHAPVPRQEAHLDLNSFFRNELRVLGTYSGSAREQEHAWALLRDGGLDPSPLLSHRLPLSRFAEAVELSRSHQALKVLLVPDS